MLRAIALRNCGSYAPPPGTRRRWPSAWRDWCWITRSGVGSVRRRGWEREACTLIESIGDATLTVGLSFPVIYAKAHSGEWSDVLRWSQRVIDLADGDP